MIPHPCRHARRQPDPRLVRAARPAVETLEERRLLSTLTLTGPGTVPAEPAALLNGTLLVQGTHRGDRIVFSVDPKFPGALKVDVNKSSASFPIADVKNIRTYGYGGSDQVTFDVSAREVTTPRVWVFGGNGNDSLVGGAANDSLIGGRGDDLLEGNAGNDYIEGNAGNDRIKGGDGADALFGGFGNDTINTGEGNDRVKGQEGVDVVDTGDALLASSMKKARFNDDSITRRWGARGRPAAYNSTIIGYTPAQVRKAYGFGDLSDASFTNRGQGQYIAVVTAYEYLTSREDLNYFSREFGLPQVNRTTFRRMWASGHQPTVDPTWAEEAALDLQWAHAIAPEATLIHVMADSDAKGDMFEAIGAASRLLDRLGGGVVTMSFGFAEQATDQALEAQFRTYTSDKVSFVASAGNAAGTIAYPAASEEVLSVGGTFLPLDQNGNRTGEETVWSQAGGGQSLFRDRPDYQAQLLVNGTPIDTARVLPDVSYNADPLSGFAVFSQTPNANGDTGWRGLGGTSAGAPQWAGLLALANQRRLEHRLPVLGNKQAQNFIYGIARKYYTKTFNDIVTGDNGNPAGPGFDLASGWGTPKVGELLNQLAIAQSKANSVSARFRSAFKWEADFTREIGSGLGANIPAVIHFTGSGGARVDPTTTNLEFSVVDPTMISMGPPAVFAILDDIQIDATGLTRTGNLVEGRGTAFVLLRDGTPGIFLLRFVGYLSRVNGANEINGDFIAISSRNRVLQQGTQPVLYGKFAVDGNFDSFPKQFAG